MITKDTRAIMAVHIYGYPCDMVVINKIAEKYGLLVLEDAAESLGSTLFGEKCGVLSECSAFSLFANKVVTSGEGGMVVTNNEKVYNRARYLRNLAFPLSGPRDYIHDEVGYNYRLSNLLAAIGVAQMENIDKLVQSRSNNANLYMEILNKDNRIGFQPNSGGIYNSRWMFGITLNQELSRYANSVRKQLAELGIETRPFFKPMHSQKAIRNKPNRVDGEMPVSNTLGETGFYLPSSSHLKSDEIIEISENLLEIVAKLEC
jgi:perosamine synthetase